jgi:hypothetical protein
VPLLRAARRGADLEVIYRAEVCLRQLDEPGERARLVAAARVLAERRPAGAAAALLAGLPDWAGEEDVWEALLHALARIGPADPAVVSALADREPARRAAAAFVLGRLAPGRRAAVRRLLDAPEAWVRHHAARGLVLAGDRAAVPALAALVAEKDPRVRWQAEELLHRLAGERGPNLPAGVDEDAQRLRASAWRLWWKEHGAGIDLAAVDWQEGSRGLTLVCDCDVAGRSQVGRVWACDRDGKVRWEVNGVANPADVQVLPGGRLLVAECYGGNVVTERDRHGKVLWQHRLRDSAVSCQRLPGGNTFIATYTELLEVTPAGRVVYTHRPVGRTYCAEKLRNGNILYTSSDGRVIEMTTAGKEVRSVRVDNLNAWAGFEVLRGGNLLVAQYGANQVVEVDAAGKVVWRLAVRTPAWASRLRNGNTLVCSPDGHFVAEYDRAGKEVWKRSSFGRPFRVRRY